MFDIIQKKLSLINREIAPFSANKLVGNEKGFLYSNKSGIECLFDFYYIKFGIVYSVNAYYYLCPYEERKKLTALVYRDEKKKPSPLDYFIIAKYFGLNPDYNTYKNVVIEWMKSSRYLFYEDIKEGELPNKVPDSFVRIVDDVKAEVKIWLENAEPAEKGMLYADLFIINHKVCLVTGSGKSDACKAIADAEGVYDTIMYRKGDFGLECLSHIDSQYLRIDYCIHMDSIKFDEIREVTCYEYMQKAYENIGYCGTSIPSFYKLLKCSECKMIVVPYTDTLEIKSVMLKEYLDN